MKQIEKSATVVAEQVNDFLYLCDPEKREVSVLDRYAAAVWNQLSATTDFVDLIEAMRTQFVDRSGSLEADVSDLLVDLESRGLLRTISE
jgi:hypothetical protein